MLNPCDAGWVARPFPHFTNLLSERYDGEATYNSLQNGSYTFSRLTEAVSLLNPTDSGHPACSATATHGQPRGEEIL